MQGRYAIVPLLAGLAAGAATWLLSNSVVLSVYALLVGLVFVNQLLQVSRTRRKVQWTVATSTFPVASIAILYFALRYLETVWLAALIAIFAGLFLQSLLLVTIFRSVHAEVRTAIGQGRHRPREARVTSRQSSQPPSPRPADVSRAPAKPARRHADASVPAKERSTSTTRVLSTPVGVVLSSAKRSAGSSRHATAGVILKTLVGAYPGPVQRALPSFSVDELERLLREGTNGAEAGEEHVLERATALATADSSAQVLLKHLIVAAAEVCGIVQARADEGPQQAATAGTPKPATRTPPGKKDAQAPPSRETTSGAAMPPTRPGSEKDSRTPRTPGEPRAIRVFVSSTFRDMKLERDELARRVFPELRRLCEERGVAWGEVDLRWGITDEERAEGRVLPLCLEEIQRCRPYFIGILGERYGSAPDTPPPWLEERQPWLHEHEGASVTELEILHGVLNNPEMAEHAYFYFKDPRYVESLPEADRADYREGPSTDEIAQYGEARAAQRARERKERLDSLKQQIRQSGFPVREDYRDYEELGRLVRQDLIDLIERLYPPATTPDPLERQRMLHEGCAASRRAVYVGRDSYYAALDAHAAGDGAPLVLLGESGAGKSALLANWVERYRRGHSGEVTVLHFIGASSESAEWDAMVRRIMQELKDALALGQDVPADPGELKTAFANWLHMAAAKGRIVLVIDGLNQLVDRDQAPDLVWLPPEIPPQVRLVVSTLSGRPLDELERRGWNTLVVEPLQSKERARLIKDYLAQYSRRLEPALESRIAESPQAANPLYLRVLLEELRLTAQYETLDRMVGHYLEAPGPAALFQLVLERYEDDYERERPGLVADAMTLLWAARRGLSESELLDMLGRNGEPLPRAHWSPLYLAVEGSLANRSGLLAFSHEYLRHAVQERYVDGEDDRRACHLRLADYFGAREPGNRTVAELPWQLAEAGSWQRLHTLLADTVFLGKAWQANPYDVMSYWARIEDNSNLRMVAAYEDVLRYPDRCSPTEVYDVAMLFQTTGHIDEALISLYRRAIDGLRRGADHIRLVRALNLHGLLLSNRGDIAAAVRCYEEAMQLSREHGSTEGLMTSTGNKALALMRRGDSKVAMRLFKEQERLAVEIHSPQGLQMSLGNQAVLLNEEGRPTEALVLLKRQETVCRDNGLMDSVATSLSNQATVFQDQGKVNDAVQALQECEQLRRQLGNRMGVQLALLKRATALVAGGRLDEADGLARQGEKECRKLDLPGMLVDWIQLRGVLLFRRKRFADANRVLRDALEAAESCGAQDKVEQTKQLLLMVLSAAVQDRREEGSGG